jgi:hypothetical protein
MENNFKEIKLTEVLSLDSTQPPWKLFINPEGQLETFFNYKATLYECQKEAIKLQLGKLTKDELEENFRKILLNEIKMGGHLVFTCGKSSNFDWNSFFKNFSFINENVWNKENLMQKEFLKSNNILTKNEDFGFFNDEGGYLPNQDFRISFLAICDSNELDIQNFPKEIDIEVWLVTN